MQSTASTVEEYFQELPEERAGVLKQVRELILKNLDPSIEENMNWGMISYEIPLSIYPNTYNKKPLMVIGLAAQKNNYALYLSCIYQAESNFTELISGFEKLGVKPNMGKSCIRFKKLESLPLPTIGKIIKKVSAKKFIRDYEVARSRRGGC